MQIKNQTNTAWLKLKNSKKNLINQDCKIKNIYMTLLRLLFENIH